MRILHLLSQTELTGSEAYAATLAQDQAQKGHEVFVISDGFHLEFPGTKTPLQISTGSFWQRIQNIQKLIKYLREHQIDVIHCHSRAACRHAYWASLFTQTPIVTTLHGFQHVSFSKKLWNIYGDTVIAVCERLQAQLCNEFSMNPSSIKVLRNPMNLHWENTENTQRKTIALVGRASGPKGERLMQVFREQGEALLNLDPEVRISLVLSGLSARDRGHLLGSLPEKLKPRVSIISEHIDLNTIFHSARLVVAAGRIAVEAFAQGCEVIALGEAKLEGRVSEENLAFQLANNFGDVGRTEVLDTQAVEHEIRKAFRDPLSSRQREKIKEVLQFEFSKTRICDEVEEIYRATRLWKKAPGLPVLMYHQIPLQETGSQHRIFVTKENFEKHLWFFTRMGFQTLSFQDLSDFWFERRPLSEFPEKPLVLTFDDGYRDNFENALPLLQKYKLKTNLFILGDASITKNTWDHEPGVESAPLMTLDQKKKLPKENYAIESHGWNHLDLRSLSDEQVLEQMTLSKFQLEKDLNHKITAFAYPFGLIDSRLPGLAKKAGYDFAVNTDRGALRWVDDRFSMFRVNIFPEENFFSLWKKTSRGYRARYFKKRKQ